MSDPDTAPGPEDVLTFWFGAPGSPPLANAESWFKKDAAHDAEIRARFGALHEAASQGDLDAWKTTPRGRLALVVLLDQFSRNIHRDTPRAFAQDRRACTTALEAITLGDEGVLSLVERSFLYMPFMHAEDVDLQHNSVAAFERICTRATTELRGFLASFLDYARKHAEIIERFGRFPHRNGILERESTPRETEFLKQPGSSF
jgi:uncharacterized protein (DUF924 family)